MEWLEPIAAMIGSLGWPVALLLVALIFREPISNLIEKVKSIQWKDIIARTYIPAGEAANGDKRHNEIVQRAQKYIGKRIGLSVVKPKKVKSRSLNYNWDGYTRELFWLGHDLMYSKAVLIAGAPKQQVLFGIQQAYKHMLNIGLGNECDSFIGVSRILVNIIEKPTSYLTVQKRDELAQKIQGFIYEIGDMTTEYQNAAITEVDS